MGTPMLDDYYGLLGIDAAAGEAELRRAWRTLAARWHPDRAGAAAATRFQQIAAAYAVLSDPLKRAAYDRRRRRHFPAAAGATTGSSDGAMKSAAATRTARGAAPAIMLERLCGPLSTLLGCGVARWDDRDVITLVLRPAEAAQGGMAVISMSVELWCPACPARERRATPATSGCARCGGRGVVEEWFSAWLAAPPGVAAGEVLVPTVELPGMVEPVRFRVETGRVK